MAVSLQDVLAEALRKNGTDILLSTGLYPTMRVDGDLVSMPGFGVLSAEGTFLLPEVPSQRSRGLPLNRR